MEDLTILHEDNHIIVVLKPQNVPSCEDESKDKDLLTMIKEYIKETYNKQGNVYFRLRTKARFEVLTPRLYDCLHEV